MRTMGIPGKLGVVVRRFLSGDYSKLAQPYGRQPEPVRSGGLTLELGPRVARSRPRCCAELCDRVERLASFKLSTLTEHRPRASRLAEDERDALDPPRSLFRFVLGREGLPLPDCAVYNLTGRSVTMMDTRIGTTIAGYRIERLLGRGGMGRVYLAEDTRLGRKVALKLLDPELAEDSRFRDRFTRESRLAASLDHPNVVPIHEAGEHDGVLFISMRYVEGTDLGRLIEEEGPLSPERIAAIVAQVASALDAAHEHGLIHRDVKPGNILVGRGDHTYLTDFGLIKRREQGTALTKTGQFMGSVDYAAPEQIKGEAVDQRADVYSLGCVLYECLTGEPPYPRESEVAVLYAHLNDPVPKPTDKRPELPAPVDQVVAKAMAKKPDDRYPTSTGLADAARLAIGVTERPRVAPRPRRTRALLVAVLLAAVAAGVFALTRATHKAPSGPTNAGGPGATSTPSPPTAALNGLVRIDPESERAEGVLPQALALDDGYLHIAAGEGKVWAIGRGAEVTVFNEGDLSRRVIELREQAANVELGFGFVWVLEGYGVLERIDPSLDRVDKKIDVPDNTDEIALGAGALFAITDDGTIARIDPLRGRLTYSVKVASTAHPHLAVGNGAVWITDYLTDTLFRVDARTGHVTKSVHLSITPDAITTGGGSVWVLSGGTNTLTQLDARSGTVVRTLGTGEGPSGIAAGLGSLWITNWRDGTVSRLDLSIPGNVNQKLATIDLGGPCLEGIAVDPGARQVWVSRFEGGGCVDLLETSSSPTPS
jgi:streptogramin lyase/predicted Ser/Thr protein kinase